MQEDHYESDEDIPISQWLRTRGTRAHRDETETMFASAASAAPSASSSKRKRKANKRSNNNSQSNRNDSESSAPVFSPSSKRKKQKPKARSNSDDEWSNAESVAVAATTSSRKKTKASSKKKKPFSHEDFNRKRNAARNQDWLNSQVASLADLEVREERRRAEAKVSRDAKRRDDGGFDGYRRESSQRKGHSSSASVFHRQSSASAAAAAAGGRTIRSIIADSEISVDDARVKHLQYVKAEKLEALIREHHHDVLIREDDSLKKLATAVVVLGLYNQAPLDARQLVRSIASNDPRALAMAKRFMKYPLLDLINTTFPNISTGPLLHPEAAQLAVALGLDEHQDDVSKPFLDASQKRKQEIQANRLEARAEKERRRELADVLIRENLQVLTALRRPNMFVPVKLFYSGGPNQKGYRISPSHIIEGRVTQVIDNPPSVLVTLDTYSVIDGKGAVMRTVVGHEMTIRIATAAEYNRWASKTDYVKPIRFPTTINSNTVYAKVEKSILMHRTHMTADEIRREIHQETNDKLKEKALGDIVANYVGYDMRPASRKASAAATASSASSVSARSRNRNRSASPSARRL